MATAATGDGPGTHPDRVLARSTATFGVDLSPRTVLKRLLVAVGVVTVASLAGQVLLREAPGLPLVGGMAHAVYVDSEQSIATLFAVSLIAATAALLAGVAVLHRRAASRDALYWAAAAVLALLLALDEYLSLHEQLIEPLRAAFGSGPGGLLHYAWVVPGLVAVVVTTAVFVPFLRRLPRRLRSLVLLSGGLYLLGAIGVEMVGGAIESSAGDRAGYLYVAATTLEETLEVVAVVLLLYALLDHLATTYDRLDVRASLLDDTRS